MPPVFLGLEEVLEIHADQIKRYGGAPGVREIELLKSALEMPSAGFGDQYYHRDIFEMAAAYMFHIVQNHPFVDGNKRTGSNVADVFLAMNSVDLQANPREFEDMVLAVAQGKMDKSAIADFFRNNSK